MYLKIGLDTSLRVVIKGDAKRVTQFALIQTFRNNIVSKSCEYNTGISTAPTRCTVPTNKRLYFGYFNLAMNIYIPSRKNQKDNLVVNNHMKGDRTFHSSLFSFLSTKRNNIEADCFQNLFLKTHLLLVIAIFSL